jgi:hypothetical protein
MQGLALRQTAIPLNEATSDHKRFFAEPKSPPLKQCATCETRNDEGRFEIDFTISL